MSDFQGQVVLITGAGGNLGAATAELFGRQGARLALFDVNEEALVRVVEDLPEAVEAASFAVDLLDPRAVVYGVDAVRARFGRIDVLANVAGGFSMGPPLHETDDHTWDLMLDLNLRSVFHLCRAVLPLMLEQGSGRIINVSARAALAGKAGMGPYCAAKAGVVTLTETLAAENKHNGINVNCLLPGTLDTPQNRAAMPDQAHDTWVPPAALAQVILFLASPAARCVTGAAIPVYGRT
ncbi:MAG: SDR family oxidoreductase [Chromatiaceae bacterium]|nr:MAG: SDR family oxidoreductase [Chromatiaceae bacterium]